MRSAAIIAMALKAHRVRVRWLKPRAPMVEREHVAPTCETWSNRIHGATKAAKRRCDVGWLP